MNVARSWPSCAFSPRGSVTTGLPSVWTCRHLYSRPRAWLTCLISKSSSLRGIIKGSQLTLEISVCCLDCFISPVSTALIWHPTWLSSPIRAQWWWIASVVLNLMRGEFGAFSQMNPSLYTLRKNVVWVNYCVLQILTTCFLLNSCFRHSSWSMLWGACRFMTMR